MQRINFELNHDLKNHNQIVRHPKILILISRMVRGKKKKNILNVAVYQDMQSQAGSERLVCFLSLGSLSCQECRCSR